MVWEETCVWETSEGTLSLNLTMGMERRRQVREKLR